MLVCKQLYLLTVLIRKTQPILLWAGGAEDLFDSLNESNLRSTCSVTALSHLWVLRCPQEVNAFCKWGPSKYDFYKLGVSKGKTKAAIRHWIRFCKDISWFCRTWETEDASFPFLSSLPQAAYSKWEMSPPLEDASLWEFPPSHGTGYLAQSRHPRIWPMIY